MNLLSTRALTIVTALGLTACGVVQVPPPATPALESPAVEDPRSTPTPVGRGRVVFDAVNEHVQVSRVVSTTVADPPPYPTQKSWSHPTLTQSELLCVTPCTADLALGAHEVIFASSADARDQSRAFVTVSGGQPIVVRHALGYDRPYSGTYVAGAIGLVAGIGFTLIGSLVLSFAAFTSTTPDASRRGTLMAVGGVVGGLGLTLDVLGVVGMLTGRAERRPGSTVAFPYEGPR